MAKKMKRSCSFPMCPNTTTDRYCEEHRKKARRLYDKDRGSASQRGYDARWRKARQMYLVRNPLCRECQKEGKTVAADVVDHIAPHKGN
ncbi:5-methylcytosine-specific restriction enzyme A [Aneurinibacillus thermoaerophilus]|uniref:5-methylcytosine-specific restriction enzyme A n=2 Tax=Aneurinibacillus thermoaerophilus TaxID=143495 RepID=A0A1G8ETQ9_ANETH|nr:HNH endonuclease [Aneurinibacillus thermoaerophilus]SDH73293.1 5-methylcytosine-specific restriction enzyme A [Aneurinibacillus thermoaerophilus]